MRTVSISWKLVWVLWILAIALFAFIAGTNGHLATAAAPNGIVDHQGAATAARVNEIQASWKADGVNGFATASMIVDLIFIGVYLLAGATAAILICRSTRIRALWTLATISLCIYILFAVLDYGETVSQLIQQVSGSGNDGLAALAAAVAPIKMLAFLTAAMTTVVALIWFRWERLRRTAEPQRSFNA